MKRKAKKLSPPPHTNSNDNVPIRVLYKKVGQVPKVKIICNVTKLKQAIIRQNLKIIPYENLYIICKNPKQIQDMRTNIVLTFCSIYGDFILIDIDRKKRKFKSLEQEDITWFTTDLINKCPINNKIDINSKK